MGMQLDRKIHRILHGCDQLGCSVRKEQACHILDADGVSAHILDPLGDVYPVIKGVGVAQGIGQRDLRMALFLVRCLDCRLKVPQIVEAVKDTDDVNTVGDGLLYEILYNVISIRLVSKDVLSAEEHLQLRVLESIAKLSQSVPRIFLQEAERCIESGAAPALYRVVSDLVHLVDDRKHLFGRHTGRDQGLMRVTQHGFSYFNRLFFCCHCLLSFPDYYQYRPGGYTP